MQLLDDELPDVLVVLDAVAEVCGLVEHVLHRKIFPVGRAIGDEPEHRPRQREEDEHGDEGHSAIRVAGTHRALVYTTEHPLEADSQGAAERDPDDAGAALDVGEGDLSGAAFHPAVLRVVPVVAHHEGAPFLHHERAVVAEDGILADDDGVLVAFQILHVLVHHHVHVGVGVLVAVLVGVVAHVGPLLLDSVDEEDVVLHLDGVAGQTHHPLHVVDVGAVRIDEDHHVPALRRALPELVERGGGGGGGGQAAAPRFGGTGGSGRGGGGHPGGGGVGRAGVQGA